MNSLKKNSERVKAWLWRYRMARLEERRLKAELDELIRTQRSIGSLDYDGMPHGSGRHDLSCYIVAKQKLTARLLEMDTLAYTYRAEISDAIDSLSSERMRDVVMHRYIDLKEDFGYRRMEEIDQLLFYAPGTSKKIHGAALQELLKKVPFGTS